MVDIDQAAVHAVSSHMLQAEGGVGLRDRTPADYAIEHAGYLVTAANQLIEARDELDGLALREEECGDVEDEEVEAAEASVRDARSCLRLAIYEFEKRRERALAARQTVVQEPVELACVAETLANGAGLWMTCSGCHESNEGTPTGPYSTIMQCHLGNGCGECGGIGAIWDTTDYQQMADEMVKSPAAPAQAVDLGTGVKAIAAERERQMQVEGFTRDGDQQYRRGDLAWAATAYVQLAAMDLRDGGRDHIAWHGPAAAWPWAPEWWKPVDARRDLVRAGALIAAQIDLIDSKAVGNG